MTSSAPGWLCRAWPLPGLTITSPSESLAPWMAYGVTNHLIDPQSKVIVVTSRGVTQHQISRFLKAATCSVMARSVGSRSTEEAPKKPTTPSVRDST